MKQGVPNQGMRRRQEKDDVKDNELQVLPEPTGGRKERYSCDVCHECPCNSKQQLDMHKKSMWCIKSVVWPKQKWDLVLQKIKSRQVDDVDVAGKCVFVG